MENELLSNIDLTFLSKLFKISSLHGILTLPRSNDDRRHFRLKTGVLDPTF